METSGQFPGRVVENFWFVFFAYFLAIAAWYAVSGNVFISSRWRTIAETRQRGQRQLFILSLGVSYLAVYVYVQAKYGDFKEICLTLVAVVIAISHMLRIVLGLWQLQVFEHWVMRSISSMQSLGYRVELPCAGNGRITRRGGSSVAAQEQGQERPHFDADIIIVNDTIVGSRLGEGCVQCEFQFFTPKQKQEISCAESFLMRALLTITNALKSTMRIGGIVWPLFFSRSPLYSMPGSTPFLRPREPEELWLRWATVLISCAFPRWVTDMRKSHSEASTRQDSGYQVCRDKFAESILLSVALHCDRDSTKASPGGLLPFQHWRKFPKLSVGTFCKQEFLKHACTAGSGLPFQMPHRHAASRIEEDLVYGYGKYRSKLEEARDALPANEGEKLTGLGTEELEWLSIFLSLEDWSIRSVEEGNGEENLNSVQPPKSDASDIAIGNLCNQLGFPGNAKGFSKRLAAPFLKGKEGATLWGNRNVLTLSAHVDNWLALFAGEQVACMMQQVPNMEDGFLFRILKERASMNQTQEPVGVPEGISEEIIRLEKQRIMFQLSVAEPEFSHFGQSLTFLGCSMENLRSSMAMWVENNPEEQSGAWAPTVDSSRSSTDAMKGGKFEFLASKDFELCLSEVSSVSSWSQRHLQMRVLWELQSNFHGTLPERGLSPNQSEAILLCILSFPAIHVIGSKIERAPESHQKFCSTKTEERPPQFHIDDCKLTLRAPYGPQNVHIEVFFEWQENESGIVVIAQLCGDEFEEDKPFVWEAWRDAFFRSLQTTRQWQVKHQHANSSLSVCSCIDSIAEGISEVPTASSGLGPIMKVWKGWPPHRELLSKYEMMTDGLILERKKTAVTPTKDQIARRKRSAFVEHPSIQFVPVSYEEAASSYLTQASLIAQDLMHKAAGCPVDELAGDSCKGHKDLELLCCDISATKANNDMALCKTVNILTSRSPNREATARAVELLEVYFTSEATKAPSVRILESVSRPVQKENWVQKIKASYELVMAATNFDPLVTLSFASFCSAVPSYRKEVLHEDGIRALIIAIFRTTYSGNILLTFELTKRLESLLETGNEQWYYLACSMEINKIEHTTFILSRPKHGVTLADAQHCFMSFGTFQNSCDEENIPLFLDLKSELEKSKADAQDRLEQLFRRRPYAAYTYAARAEEVYSQAADNGDLASTYHLACLLHRDAMADPPRAMELCTRARELYTRAMNRGMESAVCPLADLYFEGRGVRRNPAYAVDLYTRAIEKSGDITAMFNLASVLQEGTEGVPPDLPRAVRLYSRAAEEGGDVDAMHRLAYLLHSGREGIPKDIPYAVRLYERAIKERGDYRAKIYLAHLLESGADGVPVNLARAIALYESAVDEADDTEAMFKLAVLYRKGTGVLHDAVRAAQLFERVIDKDGDEYAMVRLADVLIEGAVGVPQDCTRAVELYTRAIDEHGSSNAMFKLASLLEFGKSGVASDSLRALSLYSRAASEKKHRKAARRLRKLKKQKKVLEQVQHRWSK